MSNNPIPFSTARWIVFPNDLPYAPTCENNKASIIARLHEVFVAPGKVLEIGTYTGGLRRQMLSRFRD